MFRLVLGKYATLEEIERHWSFDDLIKFNLVLNVHDEIQAQQVKKQEKELKR